MFLAGLVVLSMTACGGDKKPAAPEGRATPISTPSDGRSSLERARSAFADVTSAKIALRIEITESGKSTVEIEGDLTYVAPTSVFGRITLPDGEFDVIGDRGVVYAEYGRSWLRFKPIVPVNGLRDYGGGLVNVGELASNLRDVEVDRATNNVEKFHGALPFIGFNAYIVRLIEAATLKGIPAYFAKSADLWLYEDSGLPARIQVDGATHPKDASGSFRIRMDFSSYGESFAIRQAPVDVTPYVRPGAAALTPTPGPPRGCADGISARAESSEVGRVYHRGEKLSITMSYVGPGCKNVSAEFVGQFVAGSPRYAQVCQKQCGDSISAVFQSGQVALRGIEGVVEIDALPLPFPSTPAIEQPDQLEGFRLCQVNVTFNDGGLGGTFYNIKIGEPDFDPAFGAAC